MCRQSIFLATVLTICGACASGQNDPNLVGYWNFDDGTVTDLSGHGNDGALLGQAMFSSLPDLVFGGSGFSLDLNYQNQNTDWVEVPHSESLNITHELTILAWIRPDDVENWDGIVVKGKTRSPWSLAFNTSRGLRFTGNAGFSLTDPTAENYAPGAVGMEDRQSTFIVPEVNVELGLEWSFVGVISDTRSVRFILNLQEERVPASYIFAQWSEPLVLGAYWVAASPTFLNGLMDEVRVYNRALSRREVIAVSGLADKPFEPEPADGAAGITSGELTWGRIDGTDKVYLGAAADALTLVSQDANGHHMIGQLVPGQKYFWRVDVITATGEVAGDVWTFTAAENQASGPRPSDGAEFVSVDGLSLAWAPAFGATAYDVYLGTDPQGLEPLGQASQAAYNDPDRSLRSDTVHYWRVDAIKGEGVVPGPVWGFTTMPVFAVEPNLVAWYKFERGEGAVATDWTRNGNDGVLVGDANWIEQGRAGKALEFDGVGDYVEIPRVVENDWTIMLWLRADTLTQSYGTASRVRNGAGLIDSDIGGAMDNFALSLNGQKISANCMTTAVGDGTALVSAGLIPDTDWHHVAWTRNAQTGQMALFLDGAADKSATNAKWIGTKNAQDFIWIGGLQFSNTQYYFDGRLDEIKFFNRVLTEAEVKNEMRPDKRQAYSPRPTVGAQVDLEARVVLAWISGDGATAHSVYLGANPNELQCISTAQTATTYNAGLLPAGTHYWRIGEIQADGAEVKGELWSFIVVDFLAQ